MANEEILELQIRDNAAVAAAGLLRLSDALTRVRTAVGKGLNLNSTVSSLEKLKNAVTSGIDDESVARFERLADALERLKGVGSIKISGVKNLTKQMDITGSMTDVKQQATETVSSIADAVDRGVEQVESRVGTVGEVIGDSLGQTNEALNDTKGILSDVKDASNDSNVANGLKEIKKESKEATSGLHQLWKDLKRIAKYRVLRSTIKLVTQAFKEGIENMYFYSKAVGTDFSKAMDSAASSLLYLKNSLGAALAPALTSLIPILNWVVSGIVEVINFINQLFSLLSGKTTWTKAVQTSTDAFTKSGKAAKSASNSVKELLASWDELNIIQSESNSGSAATGDYATNYKQMFQEVELPRWMTEWKPIIEAILGGVLGAIILPKIFSWLSKIFGLFSGDGATTLKDILNKLFGKDKFPQQPNYKEFPKMPQYGQFPTQPLYQEFPIMPDYSKAATDMGIFSGAAVLAAPALESIVGSLSKLKALFEGISLIKTVLPFIISFLANAFGAGKISITVDRKEFDNFKKEYDEFKKELETGLKKIEVNFDDEDFEYFYNNVLYINQWVEQEQKKVIGLKFDKDDYVYFFNNVLYINEWIKQKKNKVVGFEFEKSSFDYFFNNILYINQWMRQKQDKTIGLAFDKKSYDYIFNNVLYINQWVQQKKEKIIGLAFDKKDYDFFFNNVLYINTWVGKEQSKYITLKIIDANSVLQNIMDWVAKVDTKVINIKTNYIDDNTPIGQQETTKQTNKKNFWTQPIWEIDWNEFWKYLSEPNSFLPVLGDLLQGFGETFGKLFGGGKKKSVSSPALTDVLSYQVNDDLYKEANETVEQLYSEIAEIVDKSGLKNKDAIQEKLMDLFDLGDLSSLTLLKQRIEESGLEDALKQNGWISGNLGARQLASTGMSDVSYRSGSVNTGATGQQSNAEMVANFESGMKRANESQNSLLDQLIQIARQINNKEFSVNIRPDSTWGQFGAKSGRAFSKVTGEG